MIAYFGMDGYNVRKGNCEITYLETDVVQLICTDGTIGIVEWRVL